MGGFPLNSANGIPAPGQPCNLVLRGFGVRLDLPTSAAAPMNSIYQMLDSWVDSMKGKARRAPASYNLSLPFAEAEMGKSCAP